MQESKIETCCLSAVRQAGLFASIPTPDAATIVEFAWVSHRATSALSSLGVAPVRFQLHDQSGFAMLAQPASATERETAT